MGLLKALSPTARADFLREVVVDEDYFKARIRFDPLAVDLSDSTIDQAERWWHAFGVLLKGELDLDGVLRNQWSTVYTSGRLSEPARTAVGFSGFDHAGNLRVVGGVSQEAAMNPVERERAVMAILTDLIVIEPVWYSGDVYALPPAGGWTNPGWLPAGFPWHQRPGG